SPLDPSRYRFTSTGGTNPTLRTGRSIASGGVALTFTVNANSTVTVSAGSTIFGSVVAGDMVFVPNTTTGDSSNTISIDNSGFWQVLSVTSTSVIVLVRPAGSDFSGASETATPA